ncbi:MAG TPA: MMPL family transporter [Pseudonocardiaceae bacterium]|nr:MMPL family transporter [Pseudonocardiaceae bacterium]
MLASLGRLAYRRRRLVLLIWLGVLMAGVVFGTAVFDRLDNGSGTSDNVESAVAARRLAQVGGTGPDLVVLIDGMSVTDSALRASVGALVADLQAVPGVARVVDPSLQQPGLVAEDSRGELVPIYLRPGLSQNDTNQATDKIKARAAHVAAPAVLVGGPTAYQSEFSATSGQQLERGEAIALPIVVILLVIFFRSLLAPVVPLIVAVISIAGTLLVLLGVSELTKLSGYAVNVVSMVGLGLAVDYALLLVSRFREERAAGHEVQAAIERTLATAGRTVAFSALIVTIALSGLLVFAEPLLYSMGWGAIAVVLLTAAAALTLVPALLGMWGRRLSPTRPVVHDRGLFYGLARVVQRFAVLLAPLLVVGLVLLAAPAHHVELAGSDPQSLPPSSPSRQLFETVRDRFPGGGTDPIVVVADVDPQSPAAGALTRRLQTLPGVVSVTPRPGLSGAPTVLDVVPSGPSEGHTATTLVHRIRELDHSIALQVTGSAAAIADFRESVANRLPLALTLIGLVTFVLLLLMSGSVVIPIKAILMNVLSLAGSFGVLVWVFQDGHLAGLLHFTPVGTIDSAVPLLIFVFAFGLSMDYEVFLLSRIKENYDATADNNHAVAVGLQRTGRIVTTTAALMVAVFLGFAAGDVLTIKEIGVGMAVAIVVDATVVRSLLVPAIMTLMGRWNWWKPGRPRRDTARIVDQAPQQPAPVPVRGA